jgi:hypothetical protein
MAIQRQTFAHALMLTTGLEQLDEALRQPGATPRDVIAAEFDRLEELVAALPLTTDEYSFAANWLASSRRLWAEGEVGACRYQLGLVRKRLGR